MEVQAGAGSVAERKMSFILNRVAPVRFGSVTVLGMERFERFRFSVPAVPLTRGVLVCFSTV